MENLTASSMHENNNLIIFVAKDKVELYSAHWNVKPNGTAALLSKKRTFLSGLVRYWY